MMKAQAIIRVILCLSLLTISTMLSFGQTPNNRIANQITAQDQVFKTLDITEPLSYLQNATTRTQAVDQVLPKGSFYTIDRNTLDDILSAAPSLMVIKLKADNTVFTLKLRKADVFTESFEVNAASTPGTPFPYSPALFYWGVVADASSSLVALSITQGEIMGFIQMGEQNYTLGKMEGDLQDLHILYETDDLQGDHGVRCYVDVSHQIGTAPIDIESRRLSSSNCVKMYIEVDYDIYVNKGGVQQAADYVSGAFGQVAILYANEQIELVVNEIYVWDVTDPYTGPSTSNYLTQFRTHLNGNYNGDLAHLVGYNGGGGIAYVDVLCNPLYGIGYSAVNSSYQSVPTYNWTIEVLTHEIGHNLGSPHTHACAWNGNNTAIDGCGPAAGYSEGCNGPLPSSGTIMSYCHLVGGVGINFNNGFGPQPGNVIRNRVYNSPCLDVCGPPVLNDAGIVDIVEPISYPCENTTTPVVTLQNFGANTLNNGTIHYQLDGGSVQQLAWTGALGQNQTIDVSLPAITYGTGAHTFTAYTSDPNNETDENPSNDQSTVTFTYDVDWCVCNANTASLIPNPLTHSGSGSSEAMVPFAPGSKHPSFTISNLGAKQNGPPQNRYIDVVVVTYTDGDGNPQNYGTFYGTQQSTVDVSIFGFVNNITVSLSNGQGNQYGGTLSVSFSVVDYCDPAGGCPDADNDGVCDVDDICPNFNDNLIGTACDDGDPCTENDVFTTNCFCEGTQIPDCPAGCPNEQTSLFISNPLNHQGTGQSSSVVTLPGNNGDVTFTVSNINARLNGNPNKRYIDQITITYNNGSGTITYGTFRGDVVSSVDVSIPGLVVSATVWLTDVYDGDTGSETISVSMSDVLSCPLNAFVNNDDNEALSDRAIVYPNPASGEIFIRWDNIPKSTTIRIYNTLGVTVARLDATDTKVMRISLESLGIHGNQMLFVAVQEEDRAPLVQAISVLD